MLNAEQIAGLNSKKPQLASQTYDQINYIHALS